MTDEWDGEEELEELWETYRDKIEDMLSDEAYQYAADTLQGILDWVKDNKHITEKQMTAVNNIENAPSEEREWEDSDDWRDE